MSTVLPFVRHMLLCDDVRRSGTDPRKVIVYGLLSTIRSTGEASFPLRHSFAVYLALTEGRGSGAGRVVVANADTGQTIYVGQPHTLEFDSGPLKVQGVIIRIASCSFPAPGLYWVEFQYNDRTLAREPLQVR